MRDKKWEQAAEALLQKFDQYEKDAIDTMLSPHNLKHISRKLMIRLQEKYALTFGNGNLELDNYIAVRRRQSPQERAAALEAVDVEGLLLAPEPPKSPLPSQKKPKKASIEERIAEVVAMDEEEGADIDVEVDVAD